MKYILIKHADPHILQEKIYHLKKDGFTTYKDVEIKINDNNDNNLEFCQIMKISDEDYDKTQKESGMSKLKSLHDFSNLSDEEIVKMATSNTYGETGNESLNTFLSCMSFDFRFDPLEYGPLHLANEIVKRFIRSKI